MGFPDLENQGRRSLVILGGFSFCFFFFFFPPLGGVLLLSLGHTRMPIYGYVLVAV